MSPLWYTTLSTMTSYSWVLLCLLTAHCKATARIGTQPQQLSVVRGEDATFSCAAIDLEPGQVVFWSHDETILSANTDVFIPPSATSKYNLSVRVEDDHVFILTIHAVQDDHEGEYVCQIPGSQTIMQNNKLRVLVPAQVEIFSPNVSYHDLIEYSNLQLECRASGRPEPRVIWTRRRRQVPMPSEVLHDVGEDSQVAVRILSNESTLLMTSLSRDDTGLYICMAYNEAGSDSRQVFVDVIYPPMIKSSSRRMHIGLGLRAEVVCQFEASSPFEVNWKLNNTDLDDDKRLNINTSQVSVAGSMPNVAVLTIEHVSKQDVGLYTCVVSNQLDKMSHDVFLTGNPFNLSITSGYMSEYSNQYTLQWSVESLSPITSYDLQLIENKTVSSNESDANATRSRQLTLGESTLKTANSYVLDGLKPSTVYFVSLQANNAFGSTDQPVDFIFATAEDGRPAPTATALTTSSSTWTSHHQRLRDDRNVTGDCGQILHTNLHTWSVLVLMSVSHLTYHRR